MKVSFTFETVVLYFFGGVSCDFGFANDAVDDDADEDPACTGFL